MYRRGPQALISVQNDFPRVFSVIWPNVRPRDNFLDLAFPTLNPLLYRRGPQALISVQTDFLVQKFNVRLPLPPHSGSNYSTTQRAPCDNFLFLMHLAPPPSTILRTPCTLEPSPEHHHGHHQINCEGNHLRDDLRRPSSD